MRRRGYTFKLTRLHSFASLSSSTALCGRISFGTVTPLFASTREGSSSGNAVADESALTTCTTDVSTSSGPLSPSSNADQEGVLFPFFRSSGWREPSRRYSRQLEQRFGPLWRYHALALADTRLPSPATTSTTTSTAPAGEAASPLAAQRDEMTRADTPVHGGHKGSAEDATRGAASPSPPSAVVEEDERRHPSRRAADDTPVQPAPASAVGADPLLKFLEDNREEAVVILSMLTSLQRACHYGSEISEALSLRVRYFFHSLIHRHAIAAAWSLYERLVQMGVTLRHNDLVLLLTSLPYETNASEDKIRQYIQEAEKAEKDRRDKRRRELLWREEEANTLKQRQQMAVARESAEGSKNAVSTSKADNDSAGGVSVPTAANALTSASLDRTPASPRGRAAGATDDKVSTSLFASQPEWVRRWAMYEASMGNLDFSESRKITPLPTETAKHTAPVVLDDGDDGGGNGRRSFRQDVSEWDAQDDEMSITSEVTISLMELEAVVEHLYIMQRFSTSAALQNVLAPSKVRPRATQRSGAGITTRRPSVSPSAMNGANYAREALRVVRRFVDHRKTATAEGKAVTTALSPALVDKLRSLVRVSACFKLTAQYLTFVTRDAPSFATEKDGLIYLLHLSERKHVALKSREERFIDETVLPLFTMGSAASSVACAWWLSYLCLIKSSRPDDYMELLVSARERFGRWRRDAARTSTRAADGRAVSPPTEDHMQLLDVVREAVDSVSEATARLSCEVEGALGQYRVRRAILTATTATTAEVGGSAAARGAVATATPAASTSTSTIDEGEGLPTILQDTFLLLSATIVQVCTLASAAAVRTDPQSLATLYTFIERVVYGGQGIWAIFQNTYTPGRGRAAGGGGRAAGLESAPERAIICCAIARCVLAVAQELCLNGSVHHTSNATNPIKFLLELGLSALEEVSSHGSQLNSVTVKALVEIRCTLLLLIKRLYTFLDLTPKSQRVLFGAVRSESVDCLVLYAKLLHRVEVTLRSEAIHRLLTSTTPAAERMTVMESATPKTRDILRLCFVPGNALSSQIGGLLSKQEREWLQGYMRRITRTATTAPPTKTTSALRTADDGSSSLPRRFDAVPFERRAALHECVYQIVLGDHRSTMERELLSLANTLSGAECLFLLHLLTKNVCIADGVLTTRFFVAILQKTAALPAPNSTLEKRAEAAPAATSKNMTWMDAISVYWSAVDHTRSPAKEHSNPRRHERDVLDQLLCPLLRVANQIHQRDVGRQWRKTWARKFSQSERRSSRFLALNAQALALLGDDTALDRSIDLVQASTRTTTTTTASAEGAEAKMPATTKPKTTTTTTTTPSADEADAATPEELLLRVAGQHRSWQAALEAIFKVYGDFAEHEEIVNPYKPSVAQTLLVVLGKSHTNLSNTGLRLQAIQREMWEMRSAVLLVQLLLRARRWRKALQVFDDTQKCPEWKEIHQHFAAGSATASSADRTKLEVQDALPYAELYMLSLQACAIGGEGEKAAALFAHLKSVLSYFDPVAATEAVTSAHAVALETADELELILDSARLESDAEEEKRSSQRTAEQHDGGASRRDTTSLAPQLHQLREVVVRGRRFFLRATTKKMMKAPFSRNEAD